MEFLTAQGAIIMEWNEEVVTRVRGAMRDRARNMGCVFKAISKKHSR